MAAAARQNQATSVDRKPAWPFAISGSDSQPSPTITTQMIPVMKARRTDAFLVVFKGQGTLAVKHSDRFAANDSSVRCTRFFATRLGARKCGPDGGRVRTKRV
jgi:hypothetical protein